MYSPGGGALGWGGKAWGTSIPIVPPPGRFTLSHGDPGPIPRTNTLTDLAPRHPAAYSPLPWPCRHLLSCPGAAPSPGAQTDPLARPFPGTVTYRNLLCPPTGSPGGAVHSVTPAVPHRNYQQLQWDSGRRIPRRRDTTSLQAPEGPPAHVPLPTSCWQDLVFGEAPPPTAYPHSKPGHLAVVGASTSPGK